MMISKCIFFGELIVAYLCLSIVEHVRFKLKLPRIISWATFNQLFLTVCANITLLSSLIKK